jgi:riboflavin biosynthesis pyrimidine reductase
LAGRRPDSPGTIDDTTPGAANTSPTSVIADDRANVPDRHDGQQQAELPIWRKRNQPQISREEQQPKKREQHAEQEQYRHGEKESGFAEDAETIRRTDVFDLLRRRWQWIRTPDVPDAPGKIAIRSEAVRVPVAIPGKNVIAPREIVSP